MVSDRQSLETSGSSIYKVLNSNPKYFTIKISDDLNNTVSLDKLKSALISEAKITRDFTESQPELKNVKFRMN